MRGACRVLSGSPSIPRGLISATASRRFPIRIRPSAIKAAGSFAAPGGVYPCPLFIRGAGAERGRAAVAARAGIRGQL